MLLCKVRIGLEICKTTKGGVDLVGQPESFGLSFNCNLCSSAVSFAPRLASDQPTTSGMADAADDDDDVDDDDDNREDGEDTFSRRHDHLDHIVGSASSSLDDGDPKQAKFVNEVLGRFNAFKAHVLDNMDDVRRHLSEVHKIGNAIATGATASHCFLIPCRFCESDESQISNMFACCGEHMMDHNRYTVDSI